MKKRLKKLIERVTFLNEKDKKNWLKTAETLNEKETEEVYAFFADAHKKVRMKEVKLIFENHLEKEFQQEINKISKKYVKKLK